MNKHRLTLRALAALLGYPDARLRAALPQLADALALDRGLPASRRHELLALTAQLAALDPYDTEARYVETFDRGRATSLHLFEHVHGDSRERGPALVDLGRSYEAAGLVLQGKELPDHLPIMLEFASTQPDPAAREFLGEIAHILRAIFSALRERESPYASVIAAVLELAGRKVERVPVAAEAALDDAWAEPPAFDGCSTQGQARPGAPQPIHLVRKAARAAAQGPTP
jgi:nitrate reductase delta subunit